MTSSNWTKIRETGLVKGESSQRWKDIKSKRRKYLKSQKRLRHADNIIKQKEVKLIEDLEFKKLRYRFIRLFRNICMCCKKVPDQVNLDHIYPQANYPKLRLNPWNFQILCSDCNQGKLNLFTDDFRSLLDLMIIKDNFGLNGLSDMPTVSGLIEKVLPENKIPEEIEKKKTILRKKSVINSSICN